MPKDNNGGWWGWLTGPFRRLWNRARSWLVGLGQDAAYYWTTIRKGYASFGIFTPVEPDVRLLQDGRNVLLLVDLVFTDPEKVKWPVPKSKNDDDIFNGASIPDVFWTTIGPPWVGKYRNASLVHDFYCENHLRSWQEVHRMFYHGCLAGGVRPSKAKVMFAAVYAKGPRWEFELADGTRTEDAGAVILSQPRTSEDNGLPGAPIPETAAKPTVRSWAPDVDENELKDIERWLRQSYPDIAGIEAEIDRRVH